MKNLLRQHSKVRFHFTPTFSSFAQPRWKTVSANSSEASSIAPSSVADLKHTILRYIRLHQKTARPSAGNTPFHLIAFLRGGDDSGAALRPPNKRLRACNRPRKTAWLTGSTSDLGDALVKFWHGVLNPGTQSNTFRARDLIFQLQVLWPVWCLTISC